MFIDCRRWRWFCTCGKSISFISCTVSCVMDRLSWMFSNHYPLSPSRGQIMTSVCRRWRRGDAPAPSSLAQTLVQWIDFPEWSLIIKNNPLTPSRGQVFTSVCRRWRKDDGGDTGDEVCWRWRRGNAPAPSSPAQPWSPAEPLESLIFLPE